MSLWTSWSLVSMSLQTNKYCQSLANAYVEMMKSITSCAPLYREGAATVITRVRVSLSVCPSVRNLTHNHVAGYRPHSVRMGVG